MKKAILLMALGAAVFTLTQCTASEQRHIQESTGDALNDAYTVTTNALRNVAEGVNDAVYK